MGFNLDDYEPVDERIKKFYTDHEQGRIITEIAFDDGKRIVMKATIYKSYASPDIPWTTGFAEEIRGEGPVNKTSGLENCETSAIGRALANANYSGSKRPSREEMTKVANSETKPSEKQVSLIVDLLTKAGYDLDKVTERIAKLKTAAEASELIKKLMAANAPKSHE